jgi:hypothetical protein
MINVACFCGRSYSFEGRMGACPGCGEIAAITTASPCGTEIYRQPLPATRDTGARADQADWLRTPTSSRRASSSAGSA